MSHITDTLREESRDIETPPERLDELSQIQGLMHLVAANPATSADTLQRLSNRNDNQIKSLIAENPNTFLSPAAITGNAYRKGFAESNPAISAYREPIVTQPVDD